MHVTRIIHHARQLLTLAAPPGGGPRRGAQMADIGLIEDGALALKGEVIVAVGATAQIMADYTADELLDASNCIVLPGFVDPHTHVVWAGDRAPEFEMRIAGASYMEIMQAGGGIVSTVKATRAASVEELVAQTSRRLDRMLAHGTTTAEAKTGYGLNLDDEIKMLDAIRILDEDHAIDLVPTFLGAHAVPPEFSGRTDAYVDYLVAEVIPTVADLQYQVALTATGGGPGYTTYVPAARFCDVFCEQGVFDLAQSERILTAAADAGMALKLHVDEFAPLGGTPLAVRLGATSVDHLVSTPDDHLALLAQSNTIGVALPGTPFGLGHHEFTPARRLLDLGGALALATDLNPGTCWCESMQFIIALACRYLRLTPAEAICAATLNAAHAIGLGALVGSLEAGKQADLLLLDAPDYRHLGYRFGTNLVREVVKKGQVVWINRG